MKISVWINVLVAAILIILSLGFHLILTNDGFHLITKETLSFHHTFVDVRDWGPTQYLGCPSRIRNHLLTIRYQGIRDVLKEHTHGLRNRVRKAESALHDWVSEKLE